MMGWWNKMVRDVKAMEQETDGMWCEEFSEPMDDLDFSSEQP